MKKTLILATTLSMFACSAAWAGSYEDGVRIGNYPTPAQMQFQHDQIRIARRGGYRHESNRVSGSIFLVQILRNFRDGAYTQGESLYYEDEPEEYRPRRRRY